MVQLHNGDCLEIMKGIKDGSVDMILCDLPYGMTRNKWDCVIPLDKLWEQYHRITKPNSAIVLHCMQPFSSNLIMSNVKEFKYMWYWDKHLKTGFLNSKIQPLRQMEEIAVFYRKQCKFNPPKEKGKKHTICKRGKVGTNYNKAENRESKIVDTYCATNLLTQFPKDVFKSLHPTQKPVSLLEYLIITYTDEGDTVLDNCMGSGSTGIACINTNRKFIGIEIEDNYYNIAKERIEELNQES